MNLISFNHTAHALKNREGLTLTEADSLFRKASARLASSVGLRKAQIDLTERGMGGIKVPAPPALPTRSGLLVPPSGPHKQLAPTKLSRYGGLDLRPPTFAQESL